MKNSISEKSQPDLAKSLAPIDQRLGPIEYRSINSLSNYSNNPRKHPEKQLVELAASISQFGFAIPVLVDDAGTIIAGEARVAAARRLGMDSVPVIVAHHWSAAEVRAYRLADNRLAELAHWNKGELAIELAAIIEIDEVPVEILGWDTAEIDLMLYDNTEHVFARQKNRYGLFIRTIGIARAQAKLTLANLAYNFDRLIFHERCAATG